MSLLLARTVLLSPQVRYEVVNGPIPVAVRLGAYNVSTITLNGRELAEWLISCLTIERPMNG